MKYWQNEETGMCCAVEKQPSKRHIEVSKEFYDLHESGLTTLAPDASPVTVARVCEHGYKMSCPHGCL